MVIVETPRWLINHDKDSEGLQVLSRLYGDGSDDCEIARAQFQEIKETVLLHRMEGEHSYAYMWKRYKKRVLIAMSSQAFAQLNGINIISYYAPMVFEQAGWIGRSAILMTGVNGIVYVLSTIPPWYLVDRWGRRKILISGGILMTISLTLISYFMFLDIAATSMLVVVFVVVYNACFGFSWGPIPWLYPPEILPLSIRAKGASLSTAANWVFNFIVGLATPVLQSSMDLALYLIPAFFCICSIMLVYFVFPETKGVTLEEMDSLFNDRSTRSGASLHSRDTEPILGSRTPKPTRPSPAQLSRDGDVGFSTRRGYHRPSNSDSIENFP